MLPLGGQNGVAVVDGLRLESGEPIPVGVIDSPTKPSGRVKHPNLSVEKGAFAFFFPKGSLTGAWLR